MKPPVGQRLAAVEHADVVEAEKAALENVPALRVLAVDPPGEVQQQLVKDAFEKREVAGIVRVFFASLLAVNLKHAPRGPGVHRRVHVAERPFVGGQLAVRVHVPFAGEQHELVLGERGVHQRQRNAVKRQVPRGIPRIFPFVRHGNDVRVVEMFPVRVAAVLAFGRRRRLGRVAAQPFRHVVVIKLLAPNHAGERLALDQARIGVGDAFLQFGVKFVGFADALGENGIEIGKWIGRARCPDRAVCRI